MCYSNRYCFYNWPPGLSLPPHPIPAYESYLCFSPVTLLARWLPSPPPSLKLIISPCGGQGATVNTCKFYVTHCNGKVSRWISADNKWVCGMNTHLLPFGFSPFSSILIPETRVCQKSPLPWGKANGDSILRSHLFRRVKNVLLWMQMTVGAGVGGTGICVCATLFCKCGHFENCTFLEICQSSPPGFWLYSFSHPLTWFLFYPGEVGQLAQTSGVCSFAGRAHSGFSHKPLNSTVSISK